MSSISRKVKKKTKRKETIDIKAQINKIQDKYTLEENNEAKIDIWND